MYWGSNASNNHSYICNKSNPGREKINADIQLVISELWIHALSSLTWYCHSVADIWCTIGLWRAFYQYLIEQYFITFCSALVFNLIESTFSTCSLILILWISSMEHFISHLTSSDNSSTQLSESGWSSIKVIKHCW